MAETILANKLLEKIITKGEEEIINRYSASLMTTGTDIIAGDVVTAEGETDPDIDIRGSGEAVRGIVLEHMFEGDKGSGYELGDTIADNTLVRVLRRTGGQVTLQVVLDRGSTTDPGSAEVEIGTPIYASDVDAGKVSMVAPATEAAAKEALLGYSARNYAAVTTDIVIEIDY